MKLLHDIHNEMADEMADEMAIVSILLSRQNQSIQVDEWTDKRDPRWNTTTIT